jgi:hypothetical protein
LDVHYFLVLDYDLFLQVVQTVLHPFVALDQIVVLDNLLVEAVTQLFLLLHRLGQTVLLRAQFSPQFLVLLLQFLIAGVDLVYLLLEFETEGDLLVEGDLRHLEGGLRDVVVAFELFEAVVALLDLPLQFPGNVLVAFAFDFCCVFVTGDGLA